MSPISKTLNCHSTNLIRVIPYYMHYFAGQMVCEIIFADFIVVRKMQLYIYAVTERNVYEFIVV